MAGVEPSGTRGSSKDVCILDKLIRWSEEQSGLLEEPRWGGAGGDAVLSTSMLPVVATPWFRGTVTHGPLKVPRYQPFR